MNVIESIQSEVMDLFNAPLHGRPARYVPQDSVSGTTLNGGINATQTNVTLLASMSPTAAHVILIGSEYMEVTAGFGTTSITVERGAHGSTAASHLTGVAVAFAGYSANVIVEPDEWQSIFGGGDATEFDLITAKISVNEIPNEPKEVGARANSGDTIIFDAHGSNPWYVRSLLNRGDYSATYYDFTIADYKGPIEGV